MIHARRHESGISPSRVRRSVRLYRVSTSSLLVHFLTTSSLSLPPPAITSRPSSFFVFYFAILSSSLPPTLARSLALCSARVRSFLVRESRDEATWLTSSSPSLFSSSSFHLLFVLFFCFFLLLFVCFSPCPRVLYPTHAMLFHAWPTTRNRGAIEITYT